VPEARQIGRTHEITRLLGRFLNNSVTRMIDERRIGKTSVADAALLHARDDDNAVTLSVDLTAQSAEGIADSLMKQARNQGVGGALAKMNRRAWISAIAKGASNPAIQDAARILGNNDVELVLAATQALARPGGAPPLDAVLAGLDAHARVTGQRVVVFVDELQAVASWGADGDYVQLQLASAARRRGRQVAYLYAGSEKHSLKKLFDSGKPLYHVGRDFHLQRISNAAWHEGLRVRFREAGFELPHLEVDEILTTSGGHPLRTMRACSHILEWARIDGRPTIPGAAVLRGIDAATKHPSWRSPRRSARRLARRGG
jgi:hypothetical protein